MGLLYENSAVFRVKELRETSGIFIMPEFNIRWYRD